LFRWALYQAFKLAAEGKIKKFKQATIEPRQAQSAKLLGLIKANAETSFGRDHDFKNIKTIADFQKAVPIRDYEGFRAYVERATAGEKAVLTAEEPLMYATTSGTSGKPKYIPVTPGYMDEFRLASVISGYHLLTSFPAIAGGVSLSIASPAEEGRTPGGTPYGAISGQLFQKEPYLIKKFISPVPYEVYLIDDYETRYYTLLRLAVSLPLSLFYTLNPSTIALLCRRLIEYGPALVADVRAGTITPPEGAARLDQKTLTALKQWLKPDSARADFLQSVLDHGDFLPHKIWPTLALVSCWTKAAAAFYLADFAQYFGNVPVCDITYGASEGRGTVFMGPGLQVLAVQTHFFEFVPEAEMDSETPRTLLADELVEGQNYFILFTTSGGLYRYNINDVVKVTGFYNKTPLLEFQYKGGNICSFTGEKITELQVVTAVKRAALKAESKLRFFTILPVFKPEPHYHVLAELDGPDNANISSTQAWTSDDNLLYKLADLIDSELAIENSEYSVKRQSLRLDKMRLSQLKNGTYESFRKYLTAMGVADAQIKVSHLNPKPEVREYFEKELLNPVAGRLS
jgi:hypothetical protein